MGNQFPREWSPFFLQGGHILRTDETIYHMIHQKWIDKGSRKLLKLAIKYASHKDVLLLESCDLCNETAQTILVNSSEAECGRVCFKCLKLVTDVIKFDCNNVPFVANSTYAQGLMYFRRVQLNKINSGLQLLNRSEPEENCSLCGFKPTEYKICEKCHVVRIGFMASRVILLKEKLINDVLVVIVRSIAG